MRQASMISSRISSASSAAIRATTQWNRWSDRRGIAELFRLGGDEGGPLLFGKPNPIVSSSGEIEA